jgi:hypothetical protein
MICVTSMTARYIVPCRSNIFLSKFSLSTSIIHVRFNGIHNNQLFDTLDVVRYRRVMILAKGFRENPTNARRILFQARYGHLIHG